MNKFLLMLILLLPTLALAQTTKADKVLSIIENKAYEVKCDDFTDRCSFNVGDRSPEYGTVFLSPSGYYPRDRKLLDTNSNPVTLTLLVMYFGRDWLFVDSFVVLADNEKFSWHPPIRREIIDNRGIIEGAEITLAKGDIDNLRAMAKGENVRIRLAGRNNKDFVVSDSVKHELKKILDIYDEVGKVK